MEYGPWEGGYVSEPVVNYWDPNATIEDVLVASQPTMPGPWASGYVYPIPEAEQQVAAAVAEALTVRPASPSASPVILMAGAGILAFLFLRKKR